VVFLLFSGIFLTLGKITQRITSTATIHSKLAGLKREKDYLVTVVGAKQDTRTAASSPTRQRDQQCPSSAADVDADKSQRWPQVSAK
jgi:hypothetical protein